MNDNGGDDALDTARRPRVVWGERDHDAREHVAHLLAHAYAVRAVADVAAVRTALADPTDVVMLGDLVECDRLDLVKELRTGDGTSLAALVLVVSGADEDAALACLDAGADDYLIKPFSSKAMLARVRSTLALARLRKTSADRLAEAHRELESLSYSVSHDLRAPLRAIDGFSEALLADCAAQLDDTGRSYLDRVRAATKRMGQLIDDLLTLSRITRAPLSRERTDLGAISRKLLADLAARDPDRRVTATVGDALVTDADARLVAVLLENLLANAWKFTSKQPEATIEVATLVQRGETVFFVRDNGVGFDMKYANKLFAPFQRFHSVHEFPGAGIGLATAHRVVTRHDGRIWAQAASNAGATLFFTLGPL